MKTFINPNHYIYSDTENTNKFYMNEQMGKFCRTANIILIIQNVNNLIQMIFYKEMNAKYLFSWRFSQRYFEGTFYSSHRLIVITHSSWVLTMMDQVEVCSQKADK